MGNEYRIGMGLDDMLIFGDKCEEYLPKIKSLRIEPVDDDSRFRIFGWRSYMRMLNVIREDYRYLCKYVDILIDKVPAMQRWQDVLLVDKHVVKKLRRRMNDLVDVIQIGMNVYNAVEAGEYVAYIVAPSKSKVDPKRIESALVKNPFVRDLGITMDLEGNPIYGSGMTYKLQVEDSKSCRALWALGTVYERAHEYGLGLPARRCKEGALKWYTQDKSLLDVERADRYIAELEEKIGKLLSEEDREQARHCLVDILNLQEHVVTIRLAM